MKGFNLGKKYGKALAEGLEFVDNQENIDFSGNNFGDSAFINMTPHFSIRFRALNISQNKLTSKRLEHLYS
jgi:hypothetical protein